MAGDIGGPIRLGRGEYDFLEDDVPAQLARPHFWHAITRLAPHVWTDLAGEPAARYHELASLDEQGLDRVRHDILMRDFPRQYPDLAQYAARQIEALAEPTPLECAVRAWGDRCRLSDTWCLEQGLNTLWLWSKQGKLNRAVQTPAPLHEAPSADHTHWLEELDLQWQHGHAVVIIVPAEYTNWPEFTFRRTWNPLSARRGEEYQAALDAFRAEYAAYLDSVETLARERNAEPVPASKRTPEHFEWLVRYHVLGEETKAIAEQASKVRPDVIDDDAVRKAIRDTARLIGLNHRPFRRGRPPKS